MQSLKARVAQLVEHDLAKVGVAGSNPVSRSKPFKSSPKGGFFLGEHSSLEKRPGGGTGRHAGLKILFSLRECGFDSRPGYQEQETQKASFFVWYNIGTTNLPLNIPLMAAISFGRKHCLHSISFQTNTLNRAAKGL